VLIAHYDRAILIHDGAIAADGPPRDVISRYVTMIDERDRPGLRPSR
jgi:hypothetical protein